MKINFIDLFAGMGGFRIGIEKSLNEYSLEYECVLTSEIKKSAIKSLENNFKHSNLVGDIKDVKINNIEDFDILLGGFPCQPFSTAGNRKGFLDTRGTLFFEIERILEAKRPYAFILENVEGLVTHDKSSNDDIGNTLKTILYKLESLGYKVSWKVLDAQDFGIPQRRKRVFIVGTLNKHVNLEQIKKYNSKTLHDILEYNTYSNPNKFTKKLLSNFSKENLYGKSINDKRGGDNNIHSWDLELRGPISKEEKALLELILKERRKRKWASEINVKWSDGLPLSKKQIKQFCNFNNIDIMLDDLVSKGYLKLEYPKNEFTIYDTDSGTYKKVRDFDVSKDIGYSIPTGRLSFKFTHILNPYTVSPTLVATDISRLGVIDLDNIRQLTTREGLRLSGFPETYQLEIDGISKNQAFDLIGNTVVPEIIYSISKLFIEDLIKFKLNNN